MTFKSLIKSFCIFVVWSLALMGIVLFWRTTIMAKKYFLLSKKTVE